MRDESALKLILKKDIRTGKFAPTDVGGYFASGLQIQCEIIDAAGARVVFDKRGV